MNDTFKFRSDIVYGREMPAFSQDEIKNEPMLFNCTADVAWSLGGPITQAFLDAAEIDGRQDVIVDSRCHMLMKGWFPAIPGWHHDDVPRSGSGDQPNYDTPEYRAKHAFALVNGEICPTQFAIGDCQMPRPQNGETTYKVWHPIVQNLVDSGNLKLLDSPSNRIMFFDWQTFHQAQRAKSPGWRWFGRASFNTGRKPTNEIRRQVQVYLEFPMEGW
jgi:hypothetical protein